MSNEKHALLKAIGSGAVLTALGPAERKAINDALDEIVVLKFTTDETIKELLTSRAWFERRVFALEKELREREIDAQKMGIIIQSDTHRLNKLVPENHQLKLENASLLARLGDSGGLDVGKIQSVDTKLVGNHSGKCAGSSAPGRGHIAPTEFCARGPAPFRK